MTPIPYLNQKFSSQSLYNQKKVTTTRGKSLECIRWLLPFCQKKKKLTTTLIFYKS